jgi:protein ImuB
MIAAMTVEPFPLWLAVRAQPELVNRPLVTVTRDHIVHVSALARTLRLEAGMPLLTARGYTEDLIMVPADAPTLQAQWEALLEELNGVSPWVEPLRQGRVLLRVDDVEARHLAETYGARVGLAPYREPALLAALATFEGQVRVVEDAVAFLKRLPLRFLRGIGLSPGAQERLRYLSIDTLGDLFPWRRAQLEAYLGQEAKEVLPFLHGPWRDEVLPYLPPPAIEVHYAFEDAVTEPRDIVPVLERLARKVVRSLNDEVANDRVANDRVAGRLTLGVQAQGLTFTAARIPKEPLKDDMTICRLALLVLVDTGAQPLGIQTLTLRLSGLTRPSVQQGLWPVREKRQKAIDAVSARFPQALVCFRPEDPFAHAREQRYSTVRLGTGEIKGG